MANLGRYGAEVNPQTLIKNIQQFRSFGFLDRITESVILSCVLDGSTFRQGFNQYAVGELIKGGGSFESLCNMLPVRAAQPCHQLAALAVGIEKPHFEESSILFISKPLIHDGGEYLLGLFCAQDEQHKRLRLHAIPLESREHPFGEKIHVVVAEV